ncbi:MAG TPA: hypothetical protein HA302_02005 [Thermococcaceae archaeon]|nr:MAG: Uncharacterized protein XD61_1197 [Thermococcus sp. 40_45]MDK2853910.1 hypothetical protein [Thermococcaceae archaeon]HII66790.1 hypothetical protein [Thermococcaceae archaeon]
MRKTVVVIGIVFLILLTIFYLYKNSQEPTTSPQITHKDNQTFTESPTKITDSVSHNTYRLIPSYVGYAYVYPNEPITLTFYWCYPKDFNSSTSVVVSLARFHEIYDYERLISINRSFSDYIPLSITMNFSRPNYQYNFGANAKTTLWVGETVANESSVFVDLTVQVANITPKDVPIEFGHYSSGYISFTKDKEVIVYAAEIRNPTERLVEILNVSYPRLLIIPQYNISLLKFGILNASDASQVPTTPPEDLRMVLSPHERGILVTYLYIDENVQGFYFKPKITLRIGDREMVVPGPPFSYVRITEPCNTNS